MTKTELKQNVTKINKLIRSGNYEGGIELALTLNNKDINKGIAKTLSVKIKKMLKIRDYKIIDSAIELIRKLNEPSIIETLLEGCTISSNIIKPNNIFSGSEPAQPYLIYALINLIGLSDDRVKPNLSIKIKVLNGYSFWHHSYFNYYDYGKFPIGLTKFKNLETLDISNLKLKFLPDEISKLSKLKFLNIGSNELENLPDGLFELSNLEELNMRYCSGSKELINHIPNSIANLKKLKKLKIGSMKQLSIEETIGAIAGIGNLNELDISYNNIYEIPDNIDNLQGIEYLDLSGNSGLYKISNDLPKLMKIKSLKAVNLKNIPMFSDKDKEMIKNKLQGIDVSFDDNAYYQFERVRIAFETAKSTKSLGIDFPEN